MERVFNEDKTQELTEYDLTLGKLVKDKLFVAHHEAVPEVVAKTVEEKVAAYQAEGQSVEQHNGTYYLVVAQYPNGGKDIEEIFPTEAVPAKEAYDEYEDIYVYIPYTENELAAVAANNAILEAKAYLSKTDYIVLKIAEATAEGDAEQVTALQAEYAEQLAARKQARVTVNENEGVLKKEGEVNEL